jgi:serine/threonine protein kinase
MVFDAFKSAFSQVRLSSLWLDTSTDCQIQRQKSTPIYLPILRHDLSSDCASNLNSADLTATRSMRLEDLHILKLLGSGASGTVYLARAKGTHKLFALKVIKKQGRCAAALAGIVYEQRIQAMVSDQNYFVSLEASWHDENNFYLAMVCSRRIHYAVLTLLLQPYYAGGDLAIEIMRCRKFESARARFYAAEMVRELLDLHPHDSFILCHSGRCD